MSLLLLTCLTMPVTFNQVDHTASISDGTGKLSIRLKIGQGCVVDRIDVAGQVVSDSASGASTGIQVDGKWSTSEHSSQAPKLAIGHHSLRVTGIEYGGEGIGVEESWLLTAKKDSIEWRIDRRYHGSGTVQSTAMPSVRFKDMSTWTGAVLGSGGVAWCKLLDAPNATYAVRTDSATLWNRAFDPCLSIAAVGSTDIERAMRFTREPSGAFTVASAITRAPLAPRSLQVRFQKDRQDIWAPFNVSESESVSATYALSARSYSATYGRGDLKGLDTKAITEMVNTIGRIGVIDRGRVGTNGWYSGYICMHEPWQARVGTAIDDPNYTRSESEWLDYAREHAIRKDGMVMSRWFYYPWDAQPGTFDEKTGFYEAQWGRLMDSQTSYVWNVADQFDQTGDREWLVRQKGACEAALEYLLRRDSDQNGLVEMENKLTKQRRSSDWLDIVWASNENAFVNAQLYGALIHWAKIEQLLGDTHRAASYRARASKLKDSFNKSVDDGGFWDPEKGWYVYWRDADGSIHGNNLTVEVNLTAIADGICDDPIRRKRLLETIESRMKKESLLVWPACFDSYAPGEGMDDPFPKYENGDIFLSWAEYGVKAYATYDPYVALKYVKQLVDQYNKDGLAYQRYLRGNGQGAGDDILAGNCNVITGLYRDIYGIQPRYNRLLLDPHLVPELNGTTVKYRFRGRALNIRLAVDDYEIAHENIAIRGSSAFGVEFGADRATYFKGQDDEPTMTIEVPRGVRLTTRVGYGAKGLHWTLLSPKGASVVHTFPSLLGASRYRVVSSGKTLAFVSTKTPSVTISCPAKKPLDIDLIPVR